MNILAETLIFVDYLRSKVGIRSRRRAYEMIPKPRRSLENHLKYCEVVIQIGTLITGQPGFKKTIDGIVFWGFRKTDPLSFCLQTFSSLT